MNINQNNEKDFFVIPQKFELAIFKGEKNKRIKQKLLWQKHKELISPSKIVYSHKDKKLIHELAYNPLPSEFRKDFWFIMTGAKQEMVNHPGYYDKLKELAKISPKFLPAKNIILDIPRTFPKVDFFKEKKNLNKLQNVLMAFALRNNNAIAYCQGFNFIAGQIFLVNENEEEVFWIFTKIIEDYLPFDYYLKFSGVRTDTNILLSILNKKMDYIKKSEEMGLCLMNLINKCLISIYAEIFETPILRHIWDIFFIFGDLIIFRVFKFVAYSLLEKKQIKYSLDKIHEEIIERIKHIDNTDLLDYFLIYDNSINASYISESRRRKKEKVYMDNSKYREEQVDPNLICDKRTPYCFFNKDMNIVDNYNEYKIFRIRQNPKYDENFFKDRFKNETNRINAQKNKENIINEPEKNEKVDISDLDNVLLERIKHVCK